MRQQLYNECCWGAGRCKNWCTCEPDRLYRRRAFEDEAGRGGPGIEHPEGRDHPVPEDLAEALGGLINPGTAYNTLGWKMLEYMIRFFEAVKRLERSNAVTR